MIKTQSAITKQSVASTTKFPSEVPTTDPTRTTDLQIQTYLPSLYLKKYRKVEGLNRIRSQFPSIENSQTDANRPIQRPLHAWDHVLDDIKQRRHIMTELKKHEIALKVFIAKKCQRKYKKRELKKEEVVCFHRVISSHIAERVLKKFTEVKEKEPEKPVPPPPDNQGLERMDSLPHMTNDVFFDNVEDMGVPRNDREIGLFDDLLEMPAPTTAKKVEQVVGVGTVDKYIARMIESDPLTQQQPHARRKQLLRKIRQNLKKRQKYKDRTQGNAVQKTGGAELILSNLINNQPEDEPKESPAPLARGISNSSITEMKKKRRKEEAFSLNWAEEEYRDVANAKKFIEGKNTKFDNMNELLTLFVIKDPKSEHYAKAFEKTILNDKDFPKKLQAIRPMEHSQQTRYSDSFYDRSYDSLKNECNLSELIQHFTEQSQYLFPQKSNTTSCKSSQQIKQIFTGGRLDLNNKALRYDKCLVHIMDEQFFSTNPALKNLVDLRELYFLIEYYLAQFGNNWTLITQCLRLNPIARSMMLSCEQVENLHAYYNMRRGKNITCRDKLLLPFTNEFAGLSLEHTQPNDKQEIDLDNYEKEIKDALNETPKECRSVVDKQFDRFSRKCAEIGIPENHRTLIDTMMRDEEEILKKTLEGWRIKKEEKSFDEKKNDKLVYAYETKQLLPKGVKSATMKRRKFMPDKTSPLLQTMAKIRSRQQTAQPQNSYLSTLKKVDNLIATPVTPIIPPSTIVKAEPPRPVKIEKDPPELKKVRDEKKQQKEKSVTPKKATSGKDADEKKSGHKDRKKKDEKK